MNKADRKAILFVYIVIFFICLGFTAFTVNNMIKVTAIQQDISKDLNIPIYDPYSLMWIILSITPTFYLLIKIVKILKER